MPIYEYRCENCGAIFTALQPMSASKEGATCEVCSSKKTRRVLSLFASVSKGDSRCMPSCPPSG